LVLQYIGFSLLGNAEQLWPALVEGRVPPALFNRRLLVVAALILIVGIYPNVDRFHASTDGWWRYFRSIFLCVVGLAFGALATTFTGGFQLTLLVIAVVACLGGVGLTATTYYDV
jgi:hypothetical protein